MERGHISDVPGTPSDKPTGAGTCLCSDGEDLSSREAVGAGLFGGPASASGLEQ